MAIVHKIGRRKKSVARVYLQEGTGEIYINGRTLEDYFGTDVLRYKVEQPFLITGTKDKYNVDVKVFGGGTTGQAEAIRLAISRALCEIDSEFRLELKPEGLLTRDPRMVERKKYGQKKARKKFQFSKR
ncbi:MULTISPECIES: 30S ribosomal protein S9 [Weeksella]|uniref:Small ribosomal subunit protein uS9 n=1 Tax=Weeksella virosa (strain ATCC 43766 / DSM 16922 / JCM 21250 / CCUG 30538 / CDC 9751 / IAM 14551 / NBRC 16016 / NCTC 11634 / CL345/78) TaxID=865938 RepID=F0NZ22_WEEVC|nr:MULTISPECIES: 30S ribosomal protein S9 [Weeksella]ADX68239.1 ribosomal protein S9 [Weeksella virosa DSM 16922]MDK7374659.1 30S ribosomal protein S9 [Weeksella virosa]MDK7674807.1 30S ribosomal protein S9 [Weeksella virosa]OFM83249.1 30S ribosomal protein S9 [Weeksella sp. HMSC059D05]SUP54552.1 30S ribosomal protein S9 [Weeksella virosa]